MRKQVAFGRLYPKLSVAPPWSPIDDTAGNNHLLRLQWQRETIVVVGADAESRLVVTTKLFASYLLLIGEALCGAPTHPPRGMVRGP
jgi:hypothetical protein